MELNNLSSNWKKLQEQLHNDRKPSAGPVTVDQHGVKWKRNEQVRQPSTKSPSRPFKAIKMGQYGSAPSNADSSLRTQHESSSINLSKESSAANGGVNVGLSTTAEVGRYVAIDCEMVGVGPDPDKESALARVSPVNFDGDEIYDSFVQPKETVTDWRTHVSGVSPKHMINARSLEEVQADVVKLLDGKILVGHAVRNDLDALFLGHPKRDIRDTSRHPPFRKFAGGGSPRLKALASELLGMEIQGGAHSSVEDARACMLLFRQYKAEFDREHVLRWPARSHPESLKQADGEKAKNPKKRKSKSKRKK